MIKTIVVEGSYSSCYIDSIRDMEHIANMKMNQLEKKGNTILGVSWEECGLLKGPAKCIITYRTED